MEWRKEEQIFDEEEGRRRIENGFSVLGVYAEELSFDVTLQNFSLNCNNGDCYAEN